MPIPKTMKLQHASAAELSEIIVYYDKAPEEERQQLFAAADAIRREHYGKSVYFRALIEFSSFCKNDCYYCGIRAGNPNAVRYRLSPEEILACCEKGYRLGFRTFVLQSGEDLFYTDEVMQRLIAEIKTRFSDCALTLSLGEKSAETYQKYFDAGADRYLLREETALGSHYQKLHPAEMSVENRKQCLYNLKKIGFQTGAGFMVESPFQTKDNIAADLVFLRELEPHMIGIGPFIPHKDTIFRDEPTPSPRLTLVLLALIRIMLPKTLLPATTALGTIDPAGREKGLKAGANVVMPNISPLLHRKDYALYDNKICMGEEAAECVRCLCGRIKAAGYEPDFSRGDYIVFTAGNAGSEHIRKAGRVN